jgi:hypothetical protein
MVIGIDCTGSCKFNYHVITTTTVHTVEWFQYMIKFVTDRFSPGPPVSNTNKTDRHDQIEILLKVAFNTITLIPTKHATQITLQ